MNMLKSAFEIVSKLSVDEIATIRKYLSVFNKQGKVPSSRSIKLFDHLVKIKDGEFNEADIELSVYKTPNPVAFKRLVIRLREKILEALIIDVNIDREDYAELTKINIDLRKNITQAQILLERGLRDIAEVLFEKVIELCEKYELYDELLLSLRFLIRQRTLDSGDKQLKSLIRKYEKFDKFKNAVLRTEMNYHKVISNAEFRSEPTMKVDWLREVLDEMSSDFKKTQSVQVGYFYFYIEAQYFQVLRNYRNARKSLHNIHRLISGNLIMNTKAVMGGVLLNIAENDLYLSQFNRSYTKSEEALGFFKKDNFNYEQGLEIMFYAKYYEGNYEVANNIIFKLFPELVPTSNFRKGKRNFLLASSFFMLGDYATSLRYLNLLNPIETDKSGWNIGMKLLLIMTLIELKEFDDVSAKVENFRRFVTSEGVQNHRAKMISAILQALIYSGYDFKATYQNEKGTLGMLEEKTGALAWQIKSSEMAIFNQWFFAKVSRQKFIQIIPSSQLVENKHETIGKE